MRNGGKPGAGDMSQRMEPQSIHNDPNPPGHKGGRKNPFPRQSVKLAVEQT